MRVLDLLIYYATAPLRLFGRSLVFRWTLGGVVLVALCFWATTWALDRFFPADSDAKKAVAALKPLPSLQPVNRASYVIAPVAVALAAIRQSLDDAAPRELAGKNDNAVSSLLSKADIGITISRGSMSVNGKPNELAIIAPINGTIKITGQIASQAGNLTGTITGLLNSNIGRRSANSPARRSTSTPRCAARSPYARSRRSPPTGGWSPISPARSRSATAR